MLSTHDDHIDACHHLAAERRRVGKPTWDMTIDVTSILIDVREATNDDPDDDAVRAAATRIAALVRSTVPLAWLDVTSADYDRELAEMVVEFDDLSVPANIDIILDGLYGWADLKRVWTGAPGTYVPDEASGDTAF